MWWTCGETVNLFRLTATTVVVTALLLLGLFVAVTAALRPLPVAALVHLHADNT